MSESHEAGGVSGAVFGALFGALLGIGIGILIAPERGVEIRRRAAYHLENLAGYLADLGVRVNRIQEDSEARHSAAEVVAGAQRQADQIMQDANELINEIRRTRDAAS
ncbi:MAG: YtxH domain-containing protein [Rhodothermales bacterium]